ncbi:MAG TPA: hypothetical protein VK756_01545 [Solirubrobacteraceae bacterium]|jgi:hypothetical protein|nr:hypothetical protein [Solirubrobacteraceae bacterium]
MPSCEVQRTLVKSPPELWAELSDPESLARHLGEFGDIRIARVEPETAVEWEAGDVRGAIQLKASGWGTKVTLTAVREVADIEAPPAEVAPPKPQAVAEADPPQDEVAQPPPDAVVEPESEAIVEPEPAAVVEPEPERRRGLFARIFQRRRKLLPIDEPEALNESEPIDEREPIATEEPAALDEPEPGPTEAPAPEPAAEEPAAAGALATAERPDLAAELAVVEQAMVEQDAASLTAVLDRLGAAHHRPFSRG